MKNTLKVSEKFFSIQGEGVSSGYPAYFIRLKGCNLSCGLTSSDLKLLKPRAVVPNGTLHKQGDASWTCDSASVWMFGEDETYDDILNDWKKQNIHEWIQSGRCHIIWTGGEPTIDLHQKNIVMFNDYLNSIGDYNLFQEVETNGTQVLSNAFTNIINQVNCSAKLANSGMKENKRIVPDAIKSIINHPNYWFKFVISKEDDIKEIYNSYITPFKIDEKRIILMPGLDDQKNFHERTNFCLETAKKYGFIGLTRLHISSWGSCVGV